MKFNKISIVIPVFNEEKYIAKTIEKVLKANSLGFKKEIIIVDDGSNDSSKLQIKSAKLKFQKQFPNIKIKTIFKIKNEGKGATLKEGILHSTGSIVFVQDSDLEYSPDDYPILLEPFVKNDADVVYGSRFVTDRPHRVLYFWHYLANNCLTSLSNILTNLNFSDMETGFKVFRGDLIREIAPRVKSKRFGFEPEITAKIAKIKNLKIYEVGISYWGRTYDEGKKIGWIDGLRAIWEVIRFNLFE